MPVLSHYFIIAYMDTSAAHRYWRVGHFFVIICNQSIIHKRKIFGSRRDTLPVTDKLIILNSLGKDFPIVVPKSVKALDYLVNTC